MLMFKTYYPPPLFPLFQGFLIQLMSSYIRWIDSITAKTCPRPLCVTMRPFGFFSRRPLDVFPLFCAV